MVRHPPDILITTPESLYLMLTSQAREIFERHRGGDPRRDPRRRADQARRAPGDHARAAGRAGRRATSSGSGCRATQNPLEEVGRFMVGPKRTCTVVDTGVRKPLDLKIHVPVESMVEPEQMRPRARPVRGPARRRASRSGRRSTRELLELVQRAPLDDHLRQQPPRRRAARAAAQRARRASDDRPRPPRLAGARGAARRRGAAQGRRAAVPGRDVVARARHRHGRRRPRAAGRVAEVGHRAACSGSAAPATTSATPPRAASSPSSAPTCSSARSSPSACARARSRRPSCRATRSTCSRSRSSRWRASATRTSRCSSTTCTRCSARTYTYAELSRAQLENVLDMLDGRYPSEEFGELRPRIVWDRVAGTIRARKGSRALAITNAGTIPDRGLFSRQPPRRPPRRRARRGDGLRGAPGPDRSCSARRAGGSRRSRATA